MYNGSGYILGFASCIASSSGLSLRTLVIALFALMGATHAAPVSKIPNNDVLDTRAEQDFTSPLGFTVTIEGSGAGTYSAKNTRSSLVLSAKGKTTIRDYLPTSGIFRDQIVAGAIVLQANVSLNSQEPFPAQRSSRSTVELQEGTDSSCSAGRKEYGIWQSLEVRKYLLPPSSKVFRHSRHSWRNYFTFYDARAATIRPFWAAKIVAAKVDSAATISLRCRNYFVLKIFNFAQSTLWLLRSTRVLLQELNRPSPGGAPLKDDLELLVSMNFVTLTGARRSEEGEDWLLTKASGTVLAAKSTPPNRKCPETAEGQIIMVKRRFHGFLGVPLRQNRLLPQLFLAAQKGLIVAARASQNVK
ncbi:hypothetical protein DFH09DRAFT_1083442 [Mycena vulgaris]|nr:hypothetical protein DFH09DRAFT_1083442 [Mycena vulgaris]